MFILAFLFPEVTFKAPNHWWHRLSSSFSKMQPILKEHHLFIQYAENRAKSERVNKKCSYWLVCILCVEWGRVWTLKVEMELCSLPPLVLLNQRKMLAMSLLSFLRSLPLTAISSRHRLRMLSVKCPTPKSPSQIPLSLSTLSKFHSPPIFNFLSPPRRLVSSIFFQSIRIAMISLLLYPTQAPALQGVSLFTGHPLAPLSSC